MPATILSHKHAVNMCKLMYEREGFIVNDRTPGGSVYEEFGVDLERNPFGAIFAFIDEFLFILSYQSYHLTSCVANNVPDALIFKRFCDTLISSLAAVRILSGCGLDEAARTHLRFIYELGILWARALVDSELRAQLHQVLTVEESNEFWHSYLAKSKTEKWLKNYLEGIASPLKNELDEGSQFREIVKKLGISAHPSFWTMYFSAVNHTSIKDGLIIRGAEKATIFTLDAAVHLSIIPFGLFVSHPYPPSGIKLFEPMSIYPQHATAKDWDDYSSKLRLMIPALWLCYLPFQNKLAAGERPIFDVSK